MSSQPFIATPQTQPVNDLEEFQNFQNNGNWPSPFSVRYTASPYRKPSVNTNNLKDSVMSFGLNGNPSVPYHGQWVQHRGGGSAHGGYGDVQGVHHHPTHPHHRYGLPPQVIFQASQATLHKTMNMPEHNFHSPKSLSTAYDLAPVVAPDARHRHYHWRNGYPTAQGLPSYEATRNRNFTVNQVMRAHVPAHEMECLDEGYIEELSKSTSRQVHGAPVSLRCNNSNALLQQHLPQQNSHINMHLASYDPYSYVYDSQLIKEDLSVCSAPVNQALLTRKTQKRVTTNVENEYEEIHEVQRYMNMGSFGKILKQELTESGSCAKSPVETDSSGLGIKHFKSYSTSTDDVLANVPNVNHKQNKVLDQLNLEVENLLINTSAVEEKRSESSGGSYSNLIVTKTTAQCPFGGSLRRSPGKQGCDVKRYRADRQDEHFEKGQSVPDKFCEVSGSECVDFSTVGTSSKVKPKYQRSMSLIPKWKIRDHLMRLPFLKSGEKCFPSIIKIMSSFSSSTN